MGRVIAILSVPQGAIFWRLVVSLILFLFWLREIQFQGIFVPRLNGIRIDRSAPLPAGRLVDELAIEGGFYVSLHNKINALEFARIGLRS